jgi:hypothetical protein
MRKAPTVLGVLSIVFGSIQAAMSLMGLVTQPFAKEMMGGFGKVMSKLPRPEGQPDSAAMFDRLAQLTDELKVYTYAVNLPMMVLAVALIFIGYLLYKRRPLARPLAVTWALVALAFLPVEIYVQVAIVQPRTMAITKEMFAGAAASGSAFMEKFSGVQQVITVVTQLALYTPFPVLLLILIGRKSAKNDLVGPTPPAPAPIVT